MSVINLGRTTKTNIAFYQTDGKGRDGYITYNNAGFRKDKHIKMKTSYPSKKSSIFRSLIHQTAPFNYYSDGSGRDSYVIENNAGLVKPFEPLAKQHLQNFLRQGDEYHLFKHKIFLTKAQKKYLYKIKKIQDGVISRLYNDSLEKIKKNKMELRTNSINDFYTKDKIGELSDTTTPNNEYSYRSLPFNHLNNEINTSSNNIALLNLNKRYQKNIFAKMLKNKELKKDNISRNLNIYNNKNNNDKMNKKMKLLKNLRINSSGLKLDLGKDSIKNKLYNNEMKSFKSLSPNYISNKNIFFKYGNLKKHNNENNMCFLGNNTTYATSKTNKHKNFGNIKYIYDLEKNNDDIKRKYFGSDNFILSDTNKNNID